MTVQVVLAHGEVSTEAHRLGVCSVRCGDCEDPWGPYRNITGVLERQDFTLDSAGAEVDYTVEPLLELDCIAKF